MARTKGLPQKATAGRLEEKAMLVCLNISQWTARKTDKKATRQTQEINGAKEKTGNYHKILLARQAISEVTNITSAARNYYYEQTLPWTDSGRRVLPSENYLPFMESMRKFKGEFEIAVDNLINNYSALVDAAKTDLLGGMFNADDYPAVNHLHSKYAFNISVDAIPVASDFRLHIAGIDEKEKEQIEREIDSRIKAAEKAAIANMVERIQTVVKNAFDTLSTPDKKFHDTLLGNIAEVCELLPMLNITGDIGIDKLRKDVERSILTVEPNELRKEPETRKETAEECKRILDTLSDYF